MSNFLTIITRWMTWATCPSTDIDITWPPWNAQKATATVLTGPGAMIRGLADVPTGARLSQMAWAKFGEAVEPVPQSWL